MKVTPDIIRSEFIGTQVKVVKSKHPNDIGLSGKIVDETRNTFSILQEGKRKTVIKDLAVFHFKLSDGTIVEINGALLGGKPEDRFKKHIRRLW
jgi:ribonuclease P protein subunit POP4